MFGARRKQLVNDLTDHLSVEWVSPDWVCLIVRNYFYNRLLIR